MRALLISTYELGRQPFGLGSPAAWLERAGASVSCQDLARESLGKEAVRAADFIAFYVPMHTATRLAVEALPKIRHLNPRAPLCFYGLYAPVNEGYLRKLGVETILGGEFEPGLVSAFERARESRRHGAGSGRLAAQSEPVVSLARQQFMVPSRAGLPPLERYARLKLPSGELNTVGYTEASRGCKHLCRHCPVVPVYAGKFRIVDREVVLEDIRRQVAAGAEHITFGDPDFFNGPRHALEIVTSLHREHPNLTYDVTIKIEHLLKHAELLPALRATGCLFVTSAVEAVDDRVLERLDKGHTYADFAAVVELFREAGLCLSPTFVAFTPWTTLEGYLELLRRIAELGLIENVAPIQLAIRLLIPAGSRLLEVEEVRRLVGPFDEAALVYPWAHSDPRVDELCLSLQETILFGERRRESRAIIFSRLWTRAHRAAEVPIPVIPSPEVLPSRATIPYLTEPWYC